MNLNSLRVVRFACIIWISSIKTKGAGAVFDMMMRQIAAVVLFLAIDTDIEDISTKGAGAVVDMMMRQIAAVVHFLSTDTDVVFSCTQCRTQ